MVKSAPKSLHTLSSRLTFSVFNQYNTFWRILVPNLKVKFNCGIKNQFNELFLRRK